MSRRTAGTSIVLSATIASWGCGVGQEGDPYRHTESTTTPPADPETDAAYSVPADPKAEYEILVNEDLGDPLAIGEQRRLFLSQRTSTASASTLREFGLSRRSYSFRVVWCKPQKAATYLGAPEGLTGFDDSIRPDESQIERAREIARSIRIGDVSGNPSFLVPGSSTTVAVNVACSGQAWAKSNTKLSEAPASY